jgi:glycosyltransferase involved in cell wall biosynthesis
MSFKILIIVPAYNEANSIVSVIESLNRTNSAWDIMIVNDCSTDNTGSLAEKTGKAYVVNLPCNLGVGGAVQTGFKFASRNNYEYAVKFDGDGQHRAEEIESLLEPVLNNTSDVVIGSRFIENQHGFKSTRLRRIGIALFRLVNSLLISQEITDNTSGFRAYNRKAIKFLADHYPSFDYPEPEEVILLKKNDFSIQETFAAMRERQKGQSSISSTKSFYYIVKVLLAVIMTSIRPKIIEK